MTDDTSMFARLWRRLRQNSSVDDEDDNSEHSIERITGRTAAVRKRSNKLDANPDPHSEPQLYQLIPNHEFSGSTDRYDPSRFRTLHKNAPQNGLNRLYIGLVDDQVRFWLYTPLRQQQVADLFTGADSTSGITPKPLPTEDIGLETQAAVQEFLPEQASIQEESQHYRYDWTGETIVPFGEYNQTLPELLERLQQIPYPLVFTVELHPRTGYEGNLQLHTVAVAIHLMVPDTDSAEFEQAEQALRSLFPAKDLTLIKKQPDSDVQFWAVSPEVVPMLTTVPAPTELHELGLGGTASALSSPTQTLGDDLANYVDPTLAFGSPYDRTGRISDTAVGYGRDQLPAATLRVSPSTDKAWTDVSPSAPFLSDVTSVASLNQPLFVIDTRGNATDYALSLDAAVDDSSIRVEHWELSSTLNKVLPAGTNQYDRRLKGLLLGRLQHSNNNIVVDLTASDTPRAHADTFFRTLLWAVSELTSTTTDQLCTIAIADAVTVLRDSTLAGLPRRDSDVPYCSYLFHQRYPRDTGGQTYGDFHDRPRTQQTRWLDGLFDGFLDTLLLKNVAEPRTLLDRVDSESLPTAQIQSVGQSVPDGEWLWADLAGPQTPVCGLKPRTPPTGYLPDEYARESVSPSTVFTEVCDGYHSKFDWEQYRDGLKAAPSTATVSQTHTADTGSGPAETRLARPHQTSDDRLPPGAVFDADSGTYLCQECETRHDDTQSGLRAVCECCSKTPDLVDRETLRHLPPIDLKLSQQEIIDAPVSKDQLRFLKACFLAKRFAFDPVFQFDPLVDSMTVFADELGISDAAIEELRELTIEGQSVLTRQAETTPHTVYNINAKGRSLIEETIKRGRHFGPGIADLNESLLHHIGVLYLCLSLEAEYAHDERTVTHYYELPSGEIVDAVVLDSDDELVVAAEMECHNNDVGGETSSSRSTYQKLSAIDAEERLWVFETQDHWAEATDTPGQAHCDPTSEIEFRDEGYGKSYISKDPPLDYPGMTGASTLSGVLTDVAYPDGLYRRDLARFRGDTA